MLVLDLLGTWRANIHVPEIHLFSIRRQKAITFRPLEFIYAVYSFTSHQVRQKLAAGKPPSSRLSKCTYKLS